MWVMFHFQAELERSCSLLEQFKNGTLTSEVTDRELWQAQKIKQVTEKQRTRNVVFLQRFICLHDGRSICISGHHPS